MTDRPNRYRPRLLLGVAFWSALGGGLAIAFARLPEPERERAYAALDDIARLTTRGKPERELSFPGQYPWIEPGDGIYRREAFELLRCGQVLEVWDAPDGRRLRAFFDPSIADRLDSTANFTAFSSGASIAWTFRSLLPDHVQQRITGEWQRFIESNRDRLTQVLAPLAKDLLRDAAPLALEEARSAFARRREEIDRISLRYRTEFVEPKLLPLLENELWPRLQEHGAPALEAVGRDLWGDLPLLGLAWQGVRQEFDFSDEDRVNARFRQFLRENAAPILDRHSPALKDALVAVVRGAAEDPEVTGALRESIQALLDDPELRALLGSVIEDVIRGERLRALVASRLEDSAAAETIASLRKELDEVFRSIGKKIVFADETTYEVQPDFARFLRTLVLKKDRRWILVEPGAGAPTAKDAVLIGTVAPE